MYVDLLRHGALVGGVRYRGRIDDPLTPEGRAAMERVWARLRDHVGLIVTSPLRRCREPAEAWAKEAGVPLLVEDAIVELAYGDWEGKTPDELMQQYPDLFPRWRANPEGLRPPNGESPEEMRARIRGWWRRFCAEHQDTDTHALIVAHSGTIRMLIAEVLNAGFATTRRIAMPYACWSRIGVDRHAAWLEFHNREP